MPEAGAGEFGKAIDPEVAEPERSSGTFSRHDPLHSVSGTSLDLTLSEAVSLWQTWVLFSCRSGQT